MVAEYGHVINTASSVTTNFSGNKSGPEVRMSVSWTSKIEKTSPDTLTKSSV